MVAARFNSPLASSAGRLFDAVAAFLGLCDTASYEGEAAIAVEHACAGRNGPDRALPWRLVDHAGLWVYDPVPTLRAVLAAVAAGDPVGPVAAGFHATLVEVTMALLERAHAHTGVRAVCLSGGVFQNRRLATALGAAIVHSGLEPYFGEQVPMNDGGISYGQAAVAAATLARG
jgi:hydrogenase maturation protein HypF